MLPITCITVCVKYTDFLSITLPRNRPFFDRFLIITDTKDSVTPKLAEKHSAEIFRTDVFYQNGSTFNKGAALNAARKELKLDGWLLFMDADIYLPSNYVAFMEEKLPHLDVGTLYGAARRFYATYAEFTSGVSDNARVDDRVIGFYQQMHSRAIQRYKFLEFCNASRYDDHIRKHFEKQGKVKKLDLIVAYLGDSRVNWDGRKSESFISPMEESAHEGLPNF